MIIRGREQECFSNFAESNILAESVAQPLSVWDFDECTLCYFCHQHPKDDGGGGGDRGVQLSRLTHLEFYSPCSPFSIEKYKYC